MLKKRQLTSAYVLNNKQKYPNDVIDNNFKKGRKNLLRKAFFQLIKLKPEEKLIEKPKDNFGFYAIETSSFILTAKDYVYNGIVSAHSQAIYHAWLKRKPLLMFIAKQNIFFQFDSEKIFDNSYLNHRGSITMLNFKVKLANASFGDPNSYTTKPLGDWINGK